MVVCGGAIACVDALCMWWYLTGGVESCGIVWSGCLAIDGRGHLNNLVCCVCRMRAVFACPTDTC